MVIGRWTAATAAAGLIVALAACTGSGDVNGTEHFSASTANMAVIAAPHNSLPLTATGTFGDNGSVSLAGSGRSATMTFPDGTIRVSITAEKTGQELDRADCSASTRTGFRYTVTGGTGTFAGISGGGTAALTVTSMLPLTHGKCTIGSESVPTAARETFAASGKVRY